MINGTIKYFKDKFRPLTIPRLVRRAVFASGRFGSLGSPVRSLSMPWTYPLAEILRIYCWPVQIDRATRFAARHGRSRLAVTGTAREAN